MTPDSRRSNQKPLPPRTLHASEEPTLRDIRTASPVRRLLPWMGFILFCTGVVFQAGRLVERLDPQPQHKPALLTGLLAADVARSAPGTASATREPHEQSSEMQKAMQAAADAEARARELEIQLATKSAELQEARLRAENEWLRAELERERSNKLEGKNLARVAETEADASADSPGAEVGSEPTSLSPPAVMDSPVSPEPPRPSSESEPPRPSEQPLDPEPTAP